jgi:hypothetical protein
MLLALPFPAGMKDADVIWPGWGYEPSTGGVYLVRYGLLEAANLSDSSLDESGSNYRPT